MICEIPKGICLLEPIDNKSKLMWNKLGWIETNLEFGNEYLQKEIN